MDLKSDKVIQLKQRVQNHLSQPSVQNKLRSIIPNLKCSEGNNGKMLNPADVMKQLKENGTIDSLLKDVKNGEGDALALNQLNPCVLTDTRVDMTTQQLILKIQGGRAFLDHLRQPPGQPAQSYFQLHILFQNQRFNTQRVPCTCDPAITGEFHLKFSKSTQALTNVADLLTISDKINIVLIRTNNLGENFLVASHMYDWRPVLSKGEMTASIDLIGTGGVPVGLLEIQLQLFPNLSMNPSNEAVTKQTECETESQRMKEKKFIAYANSWWSEYLQINDTFKDRIVKIFAQDENSKNRFVCSFVKRLKANRLLSSAREAARFVSLIPVGKSETIGHAMTSERWTSMHSFLCCNKGGSMDHAILLCSLLLGFGLNAYVCVGTKSKGSIHFWVVTISCEGLVTFWESVTGLTYIHKPLDQNNPPLAKKYAHPMPYRTVGCIFNHYQFYANCQSSDAIEMCEFNVKVSSSWKSMSEDAIWSICEPSSCPLWPPLCPLRRNPFDTVKYSDLLEKQLCDLVVAYRQNEGLTTQWDHELSYLLTSLLSSHECERITGFTAGNEEFQDALRQAIPEKHTFSGFPIQQAHTNIKKLFHEALKSSLCQDIISCRGDKVRLSVRVCVFPYPESVCAMWAMFACVCQRII
ncbi:centrosomal protein of 76 kDa-like [Octopus sinensis]|uniref:Centrosomal protein of 76 kDa-like n=1 Tax=Octopus sinensis TaxID=2607531 RepID=A0A6P7SS54_9MOLL|nr:centrosomal protein of 76 kDa-like [Octopus sinensis]